MPSLTWITPEDITRTRAIGLSDILRTRAFLADQLMIELMDETQQWYTLYLSSNLVIQTQELFAGEAIVEKIKAGTKPIKLEVPNSFEELMAIGLSHSPI